MTTQDITLWDTEGHRLYLTPDERETFRDAAKTQPDKSIRSFCILLYYTGCRISEGLEVMSGRIDWQEEKIVLRTLKKRGKKKDVTYRAIPVPYDFLDMLDMIHQLKGKDALPDKQKLWGWSRTTAWRHVKKVMELAEIEGTHATPKGLRHGFGVAHALSKTPIPTLQRWMGHSSPQTTGIYMQVMGEEERALAQAVW